MAWNAKIRSMSEPVLPELRPSSSGSYEVFVLAKTVSKSKDNCSQEISASCSIDILSPSIYGNSRCILSLSQLPIVKA